MIVPPQAPPAKALSVPATAAVLAHVSVHVKFVIAGTSPIHCTVTSAGGAAKDIVGHAGAVITISTEVVQPLSSVTSTVYVSGANPVTVSGPFSLLVVCIVPPPELVQT